MSRVFRQRNAGPSWGYRALIFWDKWLPTPLAQCLLAIGTFIAMLCMTEERRHSQRYLTLMLGRQARLRDAYRHFRTFVQYLMVKLRAGVGHEASFVWSSDTPLEIDTILRASDQILLGTFHLGYSDLIGFKLGDLNRNISMVRLRMDNSEDVENLAQLTAGSVELIWANQPQEIIFAMKQALESGKSLVMQCDRVDNIGKTEAFDFLNGKRMFPVTIYRLARLFNLPVLFCFAIPDTANSGNLMVHASRLWKPDGTEAYQDHFQSVLTLTERLLASNPYYWFNFIPLNPEA